MGSNEQASVSTSKLVKAVSIAVALPELSVQTLPVRVLGDQRLELTDQPGVAGELEARFESVLESAEPRTFELADLSSRSESEANGSRAGPRQRARASRSSADPALRTFSR